MALAGPTLLGTAANETSGTTATITITPTANALVIAIFAHGASPGTSAIDDDAGANLGAWTLIEDQLSAPDAEQRQTAWWAIAGATPGTIIVTCTSSLTDTRWAGNIVEFTGHNTTTPIVQSDVEVGEASTSTITLSTLVVGNIAFGNIATKGSGVNISAGTGETELAGSEVVTGSNAPLFRMQSESGVSNVVNWGALDDTVDHASIAMEIAAAAAATALVDMIGRGVLGFAR